MTFYYYLSEQHLINLDKVQSPLKFIITSPLVVTDSTPPQTVSDDGSCTNQVTHTNSSDDCNKPSDERTTGDGHETTSGEPGDEGIRGEPLQQESENKILSVHVPPSEYMLGVADFTGELMRMAINSVGLGDLETPQVVNVFSSLTFTNKSTRVDVKTLIFVK